MPGPNSPGPPPKNNIAGSLIESWTSPPSVPYPNAASAARMTDLSGADRLDSLTERKGKLSDIGHECPCDRTQENQPQDVVVCRRTIDMQASAESPRLDALCDWLQADRNLRKLGRRRASNASG